MSCAKLWETTRSSAQQHQARGVTTARTSDSRFAISSSFLATAALASRSARLASIFSAISPRSSASFACRRLSSSWRRLAGPVSSLSLASFALASVPCKMPNILRLRFLLSISAAHTDTDGLSIVHRLGRRSALTLSCLAFARGHLLDGVRRRSAGCLRSLGRCALGRWRLLRHGCVVHRCWRRPTLTQSIDCWQSMELEQKTRESTFIV